MSIKVQSIKQILREYMSRGYGITLGSSRALTSKDSAGRRLQEIMQHEGKEYDSFMVKAKSADSQDYKVFFKKINRFVKVEKLGEKRYIISAHLGPFVKVQSKEYKLRKHALNSIKCCS